MTIAQASFALIISGFTLVAAISDWRTRKLPNWLTVSALVTALVFHIAMGGFSGLLFSLSGFAIGFGILLILWLVGGGGGGDVKLMGAVGAWMGPLLTLQVFLVSAAVIAVVTVFDLALALASLSFCRQSQCCTANVDGAPKSIKQTITEKRRFRIVPYAVPVAVSTWLVITVAWFTTHLPV
jgi:prepilin peptidase CpaA